ncbi:protein phosphatase 1 regulatory subunit 3D [Protopterus annectens]|uniref:protein phosphatase 1 regulatory subunit 3D n=1 Tax=Protopterus annectens TaxID=7888 RepID=UPI001CF9788A|nr:protein phosphatase 1 regulatory subunit 3D [Protopterus annectens]
MAKRFSPLSQMTLKTEQQIAMAIPRNLSYISGLYCSVRLAEDFCGAPKGGMTQQPGNDHIQKGSQSARRGRSCDPELKPIMQLRRARSLPSSPERRNTIKRRPSCHRVKFADSLGLELVEVKVFDQKVEPSVPLHVLSRLSINSSLCCSDHDLDASIQYLEPQFVQPAECSDFWDRVRQQLVSLERVTLSDLGILGTVRVLNLAFEKKITVRYSFTEWKNHYDVQAEWQASGDELNPEFDKFSFQILIPSFVLQLFSAIQFAVRYRVLGTEYWDNNSGDNYKLLCKNHQLHVPRECQESWIHFI